jgi:pyruvate dehydrogenase E1 component
VDRHFVVVSALAALVSENKIPATTVAEALEKYGIEADKAFPLKA